MLSAEDLRQLLSRCPDGRLKLDLSGRGLTSVPESVSQLTEVEVLDLSGNPIRTLPQQLCNFQNLKTLKLSRCNLIEIESVIIPLTSLEELDLSQNEIETLPQDLSKLKHLKTLRLELCGLTEVWPSITQLTSLEELGLSHNEIQTLPQDLSKLKHLRTLRLKYCGLTEVWSAITRLPSLEELDLSGNKVKTVPQDLSKLKHLRILRLEKCRLTEVWPAITQLTCLEELDLSQNEIETLPQDLSRMKHLKTLRLAECGLTEVWPAITQLTSLEELDLSWNEFKTVPQDLSKLKHLKTLTLYCCRLTEVWPAITQLTCLEELDLAQNEIETLPQDLSKLKHLKTLRLELCGLTEVWSAITQLTCLEELDLSQNEIETLPQDLSKLKHLKTLRLENCRLTEVWSAITQLTSLEELDLSGNKVKTLPQDLSKLKHLKTLRLKYCRLTEVWPAITQLTCLEELDLSQNEIETLPQDLSKLKHLKTLRLVDCGLTFVSPHNSSLTGVILGHTSVWPAITQLTSLEELDLSQNESATLPQDLSKLKHLKTLRLKYCRLTEGWSAITQLTSLEKLVLSYNEIESLPQDLSKLKHLKILQLENCGLTEVRPTITQLTSLEELDLSRNSLMELPLELTNLRKLGILNLDDNPLRMPPLEVCELGVPALFSYLAEVRLARATHCKVILLGCSMAGKTSLARTLINGKPSCVQEEDRTIVLDRIVWEPTAEEKNLCVSLFDFGGNDWYKIVHHLFIDKDSFFLLVVNLAGYVADDFERDIGSWLKLLLSRVSSPHWKLVGTHADQCTQEDIGTKFEAIERDIRCIYEREGRELKEPLEILVISSHSMSGISALQEKLLGFVCRHGKVIPEAWLETLRVLRSANHKGKPFLYFEALGTVNESGGGGGPENPPSNSGSRTTTAVSGSTRNNQRRLEQSTLIRKMSRHRQSPLKFELAFFHAIGAILWYQHTPELSKFIFHNPEYLTSLLKAVFTERLETESLSYADFQSHFSCGTFQQAKENLLERGIMSCDLLKCLWKHKQLDKEVFTAMMHLFNHMGFCYAQDRDQSGEAISLRFPWFVAEKVPDDPDLRQILFGPLTMKRLRITFEYEFLSICPPPMFEKFSVSMHRHIGDEMSRRDWKDGFQAKMYGSHLVVEKLHRGLEMVIRFTVAGSDVPQLWKVLTKMKSEMQVVMGEWPGLMFDCHVLCPHCVHQRVEKPSWFAGKYADKECDPEQLYMSCPRNGTVTEIPACLVYNVEGKSFCLFFFVV